MSHDIYDALGRRVEVRSTCAKFAQQARRLFRSFLHDAENGSPPDVTLSFIVPPSAKFRGTRPFYFAFRDYARTARTTDYWQLFQHLEWQLDAFLAEGIQNRFLLHAGAGAKNGAGILLRGASGSGKSSITMTLLIRGYRYLSDELAPVDPSTGELHPFPKPLSIKDISIFPELAPSQSIWIGPDPDAGSGCLVRPRLRRETQLHR